MSLLLHRQLPQQSIEISWVFCELWPLTPGNRRSCFPFDALHFFFFMGFNNGLARSQNTSRMNFKMISILYPYSSLAHKHWNHIIRRREIYVWALNVAWIGKKYPHIFSRSSNLFFIVTEFRWGSPVYRTAHAYTKRKTINHEPDPIQMDLWIFFPTSAQPYVVCVPYLSDDCVLVKVKVKVNQRHPIHAYIGQMPKGKWNKTRRLFYGSADVFCPGC